MDYKVEYKMKNKGLKIALLLAMVFTISIFSTYLAAAVNQTVCCQKTTSNLYCQNVPSNQCAPGATQAPTACDSTSFCKPGVCYNSVQGTCLDNTPQITCNNNGGIWSAQSPPQCNLGCCILGDQAAFVTLTRCKYLSSSLGLQTNYDSSIQTESSCIAQVQNQDHGACVYTSSDLQTTCKFTTGDQCNLGSGLNGTSQSQFYKDKLCTAPELGTNCAPTTKTTCVPGKDEIYFVDTCGNPTNIYDASKINDQEYWTNVKTKTESCSPDSGNANSKTCGNCNYLAGSICRSSSSGSQASYGNYICQDLNCDHTSDGKSHKQGESWCVYNDQGTNGNGNNAVGSRFYKHICINGEEVLEQCADFRQEECIQSSIKTTAGDFSQAACRVNRWQDCLAQTSKQDCENSDKRDCTWQDGVGLNGSTTGACTPKNSPGLQFWSGDQANGICAQGNAQCIVTFEKGLFGGASCKSNCQCLTQDWQKQRIQICESLGDCGPKINWVGQQGYSAGYNLTVKEV